MGNRKTVFEIGGWYHCYNRSIENRVSFVDYQDYQRFLELLYLANDENPLRRNDLGIQRFEEAFTFPRGERLVALGAFSLLGDRFHLALKEVVEGGITTFMRKVGTAYTLYFNSRYTRSGNLFLKPFRSHEVSRPTLPQLIHYVHSAPATLYEPQWQANHVVDPQFLEERLVAYPYSSLRAYSGSRGVSNAILDPEILSATPKSSLTTLLKDARRYASDLPRPYIVV
jgi:hypothetical protein